MNENFKIGAIITAGGNSTRFGSNKLLEKIDNQTVIEKTISKFINLVDFIVIPTKEEIKYAIKNKDKVIFAPSGSTRQKSVYNALNVCPCDTDIILIHDGARPFIDVDDIKNVIELTKTNKAVCLGTMAIDTIKVVKNNKIIKTLDRKNIFLAGTPQAFDFNLIKDAHEKFKDYDNFTDDCSLLEALEISITPYITEKNNIKITTKEDIK